MTIEQMHAEWLEWVRDKMATVPKSDLTWMAWQEAWDRACKNYMQNDKIR
jgi:hypothetical protein